MRVKKFSIAEAIKFGWETTKANIWLLLGITILAYAIISIPGLLASFTRKSMPVLSGAMNIIYMALNLIIGMGLIKVSLKFCNYEKARFCDLLPSPVLLLRFGLGYILYILIMLLGIFLWVIGGILMNLMLPLPKIFEVIWLILFFIPTLVLIIKYHFFGYFIVDKNLGPVASLKKSAEITEGAKLDLFLFCLIMLGILLLRLIAIIAGLLIAVPVVILAHAFVYRVLLAKTKSA